MSDEFPFSPPRHITDISECYFYHVMDLPGYGKVGSEWDLRGGEETYLGGVSLQGKRVLELGTASGFLCRYMEGKGAEVIGFDLPPGGSWDHVPLAGLDFSPIKIQWKKHIERLKNGWWFAHRLFESRAKVVYGNIYEVPQEIGTVDIATFGSILLHLRDPFQALYSTLRLTRELVVVTDMHPEQPSGLEQTMSVSPETGNGLKWYLKNLKRRIGLKQRLKSLLTKTGVIPPDWRQTAGMYFVPNPQADGMETELTTWWSLSPEVICRFLCVLGFGNQVVTESTQTFQGKKRRMYTVVGKRTQKI